jgi:exo-1,4-beta-D-glucosaminidase
MAMNEGDTREQVYQMWRRQVIEQDGTRFWIPSAYFPDYRKNVPEWFKQDLPTGMNDYPPKSYGWKEPITYFQWVRDERSWMFKMESGSASLPPISSLSKFLDNVHDHNRGEKLFPLDATWAQHGANSYFTEYDAAIRRLHGEPESVTDYCWKGHLLTADQHRGFYEAVNHRMWEITSGFTQWKINSSYPDVQWQNFDYYFKPVVSHFYIKKACEPLHVQMDLIDYTVTVINTRLQPQPDLEVRARVFDLQAKLLWERTGKLEAPANAYREVFSISNLTGLAPFVFVKLELRNAAGRLLSENFYWLRGQGVTDYKVLQTMPLVKLEVASRLEDRGAEKQVRVSLSNPSSHVAFFTQLALTRENGEEILPVLWDDNYFSLLPGEKRELSARLATRDLRGSKPALEVGGWNIQTGYRCTELKASKSSVQANELFTVTAAIRDTFLDGSRVLLLVDGQPVVRRWVWARDGKTDEFSFRMSLAQPGAHQLSLGRMQTQVTVV